MIGASTSCTTISPLKQQLVINAAAAQFVLPAGVLLLGLSVNGSVAESMNIGTTNGGNEIIDSSIQIDANTNQFINYGMNTVVATTIYFTNCTGNPCTVTFITV